MSKLEIKNYYPDSNIIQIKVNDEYEVIVHRSPEGEVFVDVREFATDEETNLILGKGGLEENVNDDLDGDPFAKKRKREGTPILFDATLSAKKTCELCSAPLAFVVPGIPYGEDMLLCQEHAEKMRKLVKRS